MTELSIYYKNLEPIQVAYIKTTIEAREEIPPLFERLSQVCGEAVCGKPMAIFHSGAVKDGFLVEAAFPVSQAVEAGEIHTRTLEAAPVLSTLHFNGLIAVRQTIRKVYEHLSTHAWTVSGIHREVYHVINPAEPQQNITEVQVVLHEWERLLVKGTQKELGVYKSRKITKGASQFSPDSTFEDYTAWIREAIDRLDTLVEDEETKCQVVSHCAHVFPQERIDHLQAIYASQGIDAVLREMYLDDFWYEKPARGGNVIYMRKNPFNPEAYARAATPEERRKAYCHCRFVQPFLNGSAEKLSPTFCYCGAGWYRRLWEGILGQPVKIQYHETLLRGNEQCTFTITLPLELTGECSPESVQGSDA